MIFIILCGGSGTRLWPLSRNNKPKQLHSFLTENTLLQDTVLRVRDMTNLNNGESSFYYFVTNINILGEVQQNINQLNLSQDSYKIIIEPVSRNSFPAILISTIISLKEHDKHKFAVVMSSDHAWDDNAFCQTIKLSNIEEYGESIITIGIQPSFPHTGYGYIKKRDETNEIEEFKEKPNYEMAREYVKSGKYLWNSGTFIFKLETMMNVFQEYQTESIELAEMVFKNSMIENNGTQIFLSPNDFAQFPNIPFDIAIMEQINNGIVLSYNSTWSDIGSYDSIYEICDGKDEDGNVVRGNIISYQTKNSYLYNQEENHLIATVGLDNVVIVHTGDVTLVMNKERCQDIKKIVEKIGNELK